MKKLYTAYNSLQAHFISTSLQHVGIETEIRGLHLESLRGAIPADNSTAITLWVTPQDFDQAQAELRKLRLDSPVALVNENHKPETFSRQQAQWILSSVVGLLFFCAVIYFVLQFF